MASSTAVKHCLSAQLRWQPWLDVTTCTETGVKEQGGRTGAASLELAEGTIRLP